MNPVFVSAFPFRFRKRGAVSIRPQVVRAYKKWLYESWAERDDMKLLLDEFKKASPGFDAEKYFYEKVYPVHVPTPEIEKELVDAFFKLLVTAEVVNGRAALENELQKNQKKLNEQCKNDVFNQVLRSTLGNAITILGSNWEAGKRESGLLSKAARATVGASLDDIAKYGLRGGKGSEVNKALNTIGKNSEVGKALNAVLSVPIRISLPKAPNIELPKIPKKWPKLPKI